MYIWLKGTINDQFGYYSYSAQISRVMAARYSDYVHILKHFEMHSKFCVFFSFSCVLCSDMCVLQTFTVQVNCSMILGCILNILFCSIENYNHHILHFVLLGKEPLFCGGGCCCCGRVHMSSYGKAALTIWRVNQNTFFFNMFAQIRVIVRNKQTIMMHELISILLKYNIINLFKISLRVWTYYQQWAINWRFHIKLCCLHCRHNFDVFQSLFIVHFCFILFLVFGFSVKRFLHFSASCVHMIYWLSDFHCIQLSSLIFRFLYISIISKLNTLNCMYTFNGKKSIKFSS